MFNSQVINQEKRLVAGFLIFIIVCLGTVIVLNISQILPISLSLWLLGGFLTVLFFSLYPVIGLYLMAFFLPVINWNFYFKSLEIPFIDLLSLAVSVGFFLRILFLKRIQDKQKIIFPFKKIFVLFSIFALLSAVFSKHPLADSWYAIRWLLFFYLIYLVVPFNIIKQNPAVWPRVLAIFIASAVLSALLGVWSLVGQDFTHNLVRIKLVPIKGVYPLGRNQNLLAEILLPAVFFALAWRLNIKNKRNQKIINLILILLILVLVGTFSRAAWLSLILTGVFFALYYYGPHARRFFVPILGILLLALPLIFYMVKMQKTYSIGISSTENRILLTQIAYQAWQEKPFLGQGPGEFVNLVNDNVRFRAKYGDPLDSHGVGQKVLAENGAIGFVLFFSFVAAIFIHLFKVLRARPQFVDWLLPLFCASASIFIFEIFNTSYYKGKLWLPIAISLAVAYLAQNNKLYVNPESK